MKKSNFLTKIIAKVGVSVKSRLRGLKHAAIKKKCELNEKEFNFLKKYYLGTFYQKVRERDKRLCNIISPDHKVLTGPFKGMIFPSMEIKEHSLVPKILGSYESELHQILYEICNTPYEEIINIGCAEGYYAVGLARSIKSAKVYAYDIDQYSLNVCLQMAKANNVDNRMEFRNFCSAETLAEFPFKGKSLIISDCEGYEKELFTNKSLPNLTRCDLLIEMHECFSPGITSYILTNFARTHDLYTVSTRDKPSHDYPELALLSNSDKKIALCDNRGSVGEVIFMEWAWLKSKMKN